MTQPDSGDPAAFFQPSYRVSRERLLDSAHALSARHPVLVDSRSIAPRGPEGETLALDWVCFGARRPRHALVLSSGTHGVEGYTGSAIQHHALAEVLPGLALATDTALVIQHANNPYGFAWHRRVNEDNVDFNRNFRERFDPTQCSADYEALHDCLNPGDLDPEREAARWTRIDAFIAEHGLRRFQQSAVEGQYRYPEGMQFGGHAQAAGTRHLLALVREHLRDAQTVIWLDFHTGLGDFGACELITGAPLDDAGYAFSQKVWEAGVKSAAGGESVSTPLNGLLDRGLAAALPAGARFAFAYPEYGTWEPMRVIRAMRADNWLAHHGDRGDATGRAIEAEMLEAFRPDSRDWERRVVASGAALVAQALARLPGAKR
ncbi:MAG: M14 family metallopeptidase [Burkholderiaceae bacterium]|nr:M14 family metallopeptidase [Burkholderiaceae bacterium]